jgi:putative chitinase
MTDVITLQVMQRMWPHGDQHVPGLLEGIATAAATVFAKYGLTTPLVIAHFMAQCSEECGAGLEMVENDNFTEAQLLKLWPSHFTGSMAERYAHNPRMICDVAYGGRMGNAPPPSDDGYDYRGRGLSQCTGKDGYEALAKKTGIDVISNPDLLSAPATALECGVADFVLCGCLPFAEKDDVLGVTKKLNGGTNGLAVREQWLAKWKAELLSPAASAAAKTITTKSAPAAAIVETGPAAKPAAPATEKAASAPSTVAANIDVLHLIDQCLTLVRQRLAT